MALLCGLLIFAYFVLETRQGRPKVLWKPSKLQQQENCRKTKLGAGGGGRAKNTKLFSKSLNNYNIVIVYMSRP